MIKKRFLLPAAAGALALAIGLAGIWFNQRLPALADFGVPGMDSEAQLMAWAALFPEQGVAALTFRTVLQWMAIAVFCTLGAVVLALYRYKPQKELGYFLLYLTVLTLWALVIILAPVGSSGWSVFFRRGFFTVTVLAGILLCAALTGAVPVSHGQRLGSLLLTLGYLVLTLVPLSRVRAVGLLLGMGYCLGILMAMYARGSDAALLMLFPCAITIGFRVWVVLPGMHVPFFQESVFFYLFRCARIYDAPFTLGCMAYVCRRYALQFDRAEQLARELDARVIQRTKALTEDLFLAAKLEQKQVMLNEDRVSLGEVIAAVCDSCREEAEKKGVVLQAPPAPELPVWGDQIRLQQILQNLLTNAIHYTPAGGNITVNSRVEAGAALASVRDTGCGIAPEDQAAVFDRYFHTTTSSKHDSTGLGLTIAQELAHLHHGEILLESEVGKGSCFTLKLPLLSA